MWFDIRRSYLTILSLQLPSVSLIDISVAKKMSNNALHIAAKAGNVVEVQAQIGKFDINAKGERERTALCRAAFEGHTEVVKLLLTLNPAPDVNLPDVSTPTMMSVHLTCISHFMYLYYILLFTPLGMYCYHV